MAQDQSTGSADIRTLTFDKIVKGFAMATYKFKQILTISSTNSIYNYFYREQNTALSSPTGNNIKGIPPGAAFPQAYQLYERILATANKYGLEANILWEDILADDVDIRNRTLARIAEGVAKAVDDQIFIDLGGTGTVGSIQSFSIIGREWDQSSAAIFDDIGRAKQLIATQNYPISDLVLFVSPKDERSIMSYLGNKGAQWTNVGSDVVLNGATKQINGTTIIVSNSVTASNALLVVPKRCATWKELYPITTVTNEDPYKSVMVRAAEFGVTELTDPLCVVRIFGTQSLP